MNIGLIIPLVIVGVLVAMNIPELRRYFRISRM
jgi:hypothetical protein